MIRLSFVQGDALAEISLVALVAFRREIMANPPEAMRIWGGWRGPGPGEALRWIRDEVQADAALYVLTGDHPESRTICAIAASDLRAVLITAAADNLDGFDVAAVAKFFRAALPHEAWGSRANVDRWHAGRGLIGMLRRGVARGEISETPDIAAALRDPAPATR